MTIKFTPTPERKITTAETNEICEMTLWVNAIIIGVAILNKHEDAVVLNWLEIKTAYQFNGHATYLLNDIIDNYIPYGRVFKINVVNEQTLEFYFKFMNKRGELNSKSLNQYTKDGEHHPELVFPAGTFNEYSQTKKTSNYKL